MEHYAGLDVSLERTSVCLVNASGQVVREAKVDSTPDALIHFLRSQDLSIVRVALEAGPLSQWLYAGLRAAGFEAVLLETRHVKAGAGKRVWRWRASSASSSTACGWMARPSAGATSPLGWRHERESVKDRGGQPRPARPRSHRWDGEVGEAAMSAVTAEPSDDHARKPQWQQ